MLEEQKSDAGGESGGGAGASSAAGESGAPRASGSSKLAAARAAAAGAAAKEKSAAVAPEVTAASSAAPKKPPTPPRKPETSKAPSRRGFMSFVSWFAVGWIAFSAWCAAALGGLTRFMFPNWLREPPSKFKIGSPDEYAPDSVSTKWVPQFGIWVVNALYNGQRQVYALRTVCTHLGCTPNWLEAEQKFKCPCHGSGFRISGINFEGPAPRPLERYAIRTADDGQLEVDKSRLFQEEMGQWQNSESFVTV